MKNLKDQLYPEDYTVLSEGCNIIGDIIFQSRTSISGKIEGNIQIKNEAQLILESTSIFSGTIKSSKLDIFGECSGEIYSDDLVTFHSNSSFTGTLKCGRMVIHSGAMVNIKASTQLNVTQTKETSYNSQH